MSASPSLWNRLKPDPFILMIIAAVVVAAIVPARGVGEDVLGVVTTAAIFLLFFMYGGRLAPAEALAGLTHWRLHLVILAFTFVVFPLVVLALRPLSGPVLSPALYAGVLFCALVPSTVQSSIVFTSTAGGNVAGAIVSASASNLLGVVLTPLLVAFVMSTSGASSGIDASSVLDLFGQILLPFVLGQLSRRWTARWLKENHAWLKQVDRLVIVLVVYAAFSKGMNEGMWNLVGVRDLVVLTVILCGVLALMLVATYESARLLGFDRGDRIAIQFCGTKKSLATGLPMAVVLFAGQPVGLMVLPLMIFHQVQLMVCAVLAARYGRQLGQDEVRAGA
ncbi:bile acid:sodium symporter family protein [Mobilicoccus massiliensis]|uniref:bile acid:sodium symporter family protein n=1 Tax=Mobilicoccus massiliensis TaxID=1522310 RepID=UPI000590908E|nr:bile acid:sodium symporter family protein [Mobilicoccus massiliensis]